MLTCAVIAWFGLEVTLDHYQREVVDVRSFDMPRWLLTASIPLSFGLMTIEFGRFLLGFDSMHTGPFMSSPKPGDSNRRRLVA